MRTQSKKLRTVVLSYNSKPKHMTLTNEDIAAIKSLLDANLEPIKNEMTAMKTDIAAIKVHVDSINQRLYKIEGRMADNELRIEKALTSLA